MPAVIKMSILMLGEDIWNTRIAKRFKSFRIEQPTEADLLDEKYRQAQARTRIDARTTPHAPHRLAFPEADHLHAFTHS